MFFSRSVVYISLGFSRSPGNNTTPGSRIREVRTREENVSKHFARVSFQWTLDKAWALRRNDHVVYKQSVGSFRWESTGPPINSRLNVESLCVTSDFNILILYASTPHYWLSLDLSLPAYQTPKMSIACDLAPDRALLKKTLSNCNRPSGQSNNLNNRFSYPN